MTLEERKCPNCGSGEVLEKDGTFVCMNCRTFFDNPNDLKITKTTIVRDETEIEKAQAKERSNKEYNKTTLILCVMLFAFWILVYFFVH